MNFSHTFSIKDFSETFIILPLKFLRIFERKIYFSITMWYLEYTENFVKSSWILNNNHLVFPSLITHIESRIRELFKRAHKNLLSEISAATDKNSWRLLLLYKWRSCWAGRPRCSLCSHGTEYGQGDQIRPAENQLTSRYESWNSHWRDIGWNIGTTTVAIWCLFQGCWIG